MDVSGSVAFECFVFGSRGTRDPRPAATWPLLSMPFATAFSRSAARMGA